MWRLVLGLVVACSYSAPTPGPATGDDASTTDPDAASVTDSRDPDAPEVPIPQIVTTGLLQDLDADLGVTGTTNVTAWANQISGAGENSVAKAGTGTIVLVANAIGGHAALQFNNDARLEGDNTTVFAPLTGGDGFTWFAVVEPAATQDVSDRNQIMGTIRNGANNSGFTAGVDRAAKPYAMARPLSTEFKAQSAQATAQWSVLAGRMSAGASPVVTLHRNSAAVDAMMGATVASPGLVGALTIASERQAGTEFFNGKIARILIYGRPLNDQELATTGQALAAHYAITAF